MTQRRQKGEKRVEEKQEEGEERAVGKESEKEEKAKKREREGWQKSYRDSERAKVGEGCQHTIRNYGIETLGEIKLKICNERQSERERRRE